MKCHEIFSQTSPELADEMFQYLLEHEKAVYKAAIQNIASQRKLRPVFIERKPKPERHVWLHQAVSRKPSEDMALQLLQIWLLGAHKEVICAFLDALEIKHDGKGIVDELPAEPPREKLEAAVNMLQLKYRPEIVKIYLRAFEAMDDKGWSHLKEINNNILS
jgi:hypothetical protein